MIVLLDTGVLGLVTNPKATPENQRCKDWMVSLLLEGVQVAVPEIADYEIRRELIRANKTRGVRHLEGLKSAVLHVPLTTETMLRAAEFWAQARRSGKPTADPRELDGDAVLAAQAYVLARQLGEEVVIATTNVGHLSQFAAARHWWSIPPESLD